jgi:hypothetical protein
MLSAMNTIYTWDEVVCWIIQSFPDVSNFGAW